MCVVHALTLIQTSHTVSHDENDLVRYHSGNDLVFTEINLS